jgi:LruC domain-containing protein
MSSSGSFGVNVKKEDPYVQPVGIITVITFPSGVYTLNELNMSGFNPFIFVNGNRGREVHLPDYPPTSKATSSLFGTGADNSISK